MRSKVFVIPYVNCCANCYYNFNPGETTRGERSNCFTPEKSNTFQTHPCRGENSPWKTPTLAEIPPKDCKLASDIPTHPGRILLRVQKSLNTCFRYGKVPFQSCKLFLTTICPEFPSRYPFILHLHRIGLS